MPEWCSGGDARAFGRLAHGDVFSAPLLDDGDRRRDKFIDKISVVVGPVWPVFLSWRFSMGLWLAPNPDVITVYFLALE